MKQGIRYTYFPTQHQAVIFRNWGMIPPDRLARVLHTSEENIRNCASEMGLRPVSSVDPRWLTRGYITLIRQNWELLNEPQLLDLLEWTPEQLAFSLKEDDFLSYKLGNFKPECPEVVFRPLNEAERRETEALRRAVEAHDGLPLQAPFAFLEDLQTPETPARREARNPGPDDVRIDDSWALACEIPDERMSFAVQRFRNRIAARWGLRLDGSDHTIRLVLKPRPDARREAHDIHADDNAVTIESADIPGLMRGLTTVEEQFEENGGPMLRKGHVRKDPKFEVRILYPYSAVFGDTFLNEREDPLPEGLLDRLQSAGINGIWLHMVLYQMVPFPFDPSLSRGWEKRIEALNAFIRRAAKYGIGIYLYVNEPRAMRDAFFEKYPSLRGHSQNGLTCMCTSRPEVIDYLRSAMRALFEKAPGLAGVFTITMSENLTNCYSRSRETNCPVCAKRDVYEITGEINRAIEEGVHAVKPDADVFVWNWAWRDERGFPQEKVDDIVSLLPENVWLQATSESAKPFSVGGIRGNISDYSISIPGPGDMAKAYWRAAKKRGMRTSAKIQVNTSWECGAVPYIPVMELVREHMDNLSREDVSALFLSWTLGGYPSENLRRISRYFWSDSRSGTSAPSAIERAQSIFSEAFREFPFSGDTLYFAPQNVGPANPLLSERSGRASTMVGIPYDDLEGWRNMYPAEIFERQFERLYTRWQDGIRLLEAEAPDETELINVARAVCNHFESTFLQVRFVRQRDGGAEPAALRETVRRELDVIRSQMVCISRDSRIGYEASNHYFYTRQTLLEAAVACEYLLSRYKGE